MIRIAKISLDINKDAVINNKPIILRQGESDVIIEATISNGGYETLQINFATFVAKKPDGTIISNDPVNISGNVISYPISKHLTESVGKIQDAYFMINNQITTCGFDISIIPSAQLDDTSVNYIPGIESINKFLESAEADWLGRIQQMKAQIDGLSIPDEFKLLMDKALSDAKAQYQPAIDAAEANVENIVADLAAKKLDLTNNSDELNKTITNIKAQVASITSFLDSIQKQIIEANSSFTTGQQAQISQSIADSQKKLADSIASMQSEVAQTVADLKSSSNAAITDMQNNQSTAMAKVNQNIADTQASIQQIQQSAKNVNDSIQNMKISARNLIANTRTLDGAIGIGDIKLNGYQGCAIVTNPYTNKFPVDNYFDAYSIYPTIKCDKGDYTITFIAWADNDGDMIANYFFSSDTITDTSETSQGTVSHNGDGSNEITLTNAPKLYWIKWHNNTEGQFQKEVILGRVTESFSNGHTNKGPIHIGLPMLVNGNIPLPWTPAPEDVQTAITNAIKVDVGKTITATDNTGKTVKLKVTDIS